MTFILRLKALCRAFMRPAVTRAHVPTGVTTPVRTPLDTWSDEDLHTLLATAPIGSKVGYFSYYPGQRTIDDFTGLYVTVTAERDGAFSRMAGNHGRSDAVRICTTEAVIAEIATGRSSADAFIDRAM